MAPTQMLALSDLCATFKERSIWTHDTIGKGVFHGLGVMEETLTDLHLITIADKHPAYVRTKKFARREEGAKSGADWLWVIGEPGSWLPLLVQAKIVNPSTGNSQYLDHKGGDQRRKLLAYARRHRLLPMYTIYANMTPEAHSLATREHPLKEWGCSFVVPGEVRRLVKMRAMNVKDLIPKAFPWPPVFCFASKVSGKPTGAAIASGMVRALQEDAVNTIEVVDGGVDPIRRSRRSWEFPDPEAFVTGEIPSIVAYLASGRFLAEEIPLSDVSVISTVPIDQLAHERHLLPLARPTVTEEFDLFARISGRSLLD